jgi:hypothetical protein
MNGLSADHHNNLRHAVLTGTKVHVYAFNKNYLHLSQSLDINITYNSFDYIIVKIFFYMSNFPY